MHPLSDLGAAEPDFRDYLRILRRRRRLVAATTLVVFGAALVASLLQAPVYRASAQILLQSRQLESLFDPSTGQPNDPGRTVATQIEILKSEPVRAAVKRDLGAAPKITAEPVGQTDVVRVNAEHTDARRAAAIANAYARAYTDFRRKQAVDDILAASKEVQARVADLQRQIDDLGRRTSAAPSADRARAEEGADATRQALIAQQLVFRQRLETLQIDAALKTGGAQLVTPASAPSSPVKPTPVRTGAMAAVVGLILGTGLAFLLDYLEDSIKTKEDMERAATGLPTLTLIPAVAGWKDRRQAFVISQTAPKSPAAEAYRTLRTSIQFMALDRPMGTIQVTSPSSAEGKSTTVANLAVALAQAGQEVVVVDCDLRRPRMHEFFELANTVGFTSALLGEVSPASGLQGVKGVQRLRVLTSGPVPPNPSELLSSRRTVEVLTGLQANAGVVLIDCPPVLPVTDAAVLSSRVDATLLVVTAGSTTRRALHRALEVLEQVEAPVIGAIVNGVSDEGSYGESYRYSYYAPERSDDGKLGRTAALESAPARARRPG